MEQLTRKLMEILDAERLGDSLRARSLAGELHGLLHHLRPETAALARDIADALARNGLSDHALFAALRATPDRRGRGATVRAMLHGEDGIGRVLEVHVDLIPGDGGVWSPQGMASETRRAAEIAAALGLGDEHRRWSVRWQIVGADVGSIDIHGASIGLGLAVAVHAARKRLHVPSGWAFTGDLNLKGEVGAVGSLPSKLRAASAAGCTHLALPAISAAGLETPAGSELVPLLALGPLFARLFPPRPSRRLAVAAGMAASLVLGLALAWTRPPDPPAGEPLRLSFDADGVAIPRGRSYTVGERFGVWITPPEDGPLVVLLRDPTGLVQPLFPLKSDPRAWLGGTPILVPTDANIGQNRTLGEPAGEHTLLVFWSNGALADDGVLRALAEHPPGEPMGWAQAFPDQGAPAVATPVQESGPTLASRLDRPAGSPLVALVPFQVDPPPARER